MKYAKVKFWIPMVGRSSKTIQLIAISALLISKDSTVKIKHFINYPNLDSSIRPVTVPPSDDLPVPTFPELADIDDRTSSSHHPGIIPQVQMNNVMLNFIHLNRS